jgi:hypothetical protein
MKRCPQCLFLYPEADERCDFDQTPLEVVDDAEVDAVTGPLKPPRRRKTLPIAVAAGLLLAILGFGIYYGASHRMQQASAAPESSLTPVTVASPTASISTPSPSPVVSPSPSPSPAPKTTATTTSSAHTRATSDPVSTSGPGIGSRQGAKPVITLSSGGRIEADEVWRTKDGVWYRRNGIVTLVKRAQVKSISTR